MCRWWQRWLFAQQIILLPATACGQAGLKHLAGVGSSRDWGSGREKGCWVRGKGWERDGWTREGAAGRADEGRGCRVATFSAAHAKTRLFLAAGLCFPEAGKQVKLLNLGAKFQPGPAGTDLAFPGGLDPPRADVYGAVANPSGYFVFFLRCQLSLHPPKSGSPNQIPRLRASSRSSGWLHRVLSRDAALNFPLSKSKRRRRGVNPPMHVPSAICFWGHVARTLRE